MNSRAAAISILDCMQNTDKQEELCKTRSLKTRTTAACWQWLAPATPKRKYLDLSSFCMPAVCLSARLLCISPSLPLLFSLAFSDALQLSRRSPRPLSDLRVRGAAAPASAACPQPTDAHAGG